VLCPLKLQIQLRMFLQEDRCEIKPYGQEECLDFASDYCVKLCSHRIGAGVPSNLVEALCYKPQGSRFDSQ
jgi:hypothetical protein